MKLIQKLAVVTTVGGLGFAAVSAPTSAQAAQLFNFQYSFPGYGPQATPVSATGTLTTTDLDPTSNTYTITGITGTRTVGGDLQQILGLVPQGSFGNDDNILHSSNPSLGISGFSYTVNGPGDNGGGLVNGLGDNGSVNVFYNGLSYQEDDSRVGLGSSFSVTSNTPPTPVPAPLPNLSSVMLYGCGWLWLMKRKLAQKAKD